MPAFSVATLQSPKGPQAAISVGDAYYRLHALRPELAVETDSPWLK